jgi:hypothetical protein
MNGEEMSHEEDDKPTVILDLNALRKQKIAQEEELANIVQDLEFSAISEPQGTPAAAPVPSLVVEPAPQYLDSEVFAEKFLEARAKVSEPEVKTQTRIILFDYNSDFFQKAKSQLPKNFDYHIAKTLPELNKFLAMKSLQIVVFNYDVNPKAVNQLTKQIKQKFPYSKTMIMARAISPEKARIHAATPSGAHGYYQFPLDAKRVESEFLKITQPLKKVG